ncbi:MAG: ATP-binding protein [Candidatus Odinarchaeia archaeon]
MPPKVDLNTCEGEGVCKDGCPADPNVFEIVDGKAKVVNPDACLECGACESSCPTGAITLE